MNTNKDSHNRRAFTLIELLTVIAIIGILAAIVIPVLGKVRGSARAANCLSNLRQIGITAGLYLAENKDQYPYWRPSSSGSQGWTWDNWSSGPQDLGPGWNGAMKGGELPWLAGYGDKKDGSMLMGQDAFQAEGAKHIFNCPACAKKKRGYSANERVMVMIGNPRVRVADLSAPSQIVMIADDNWDSPSFTGSVPLSRFNESNWKTSLGFQRHGSNSANILFADFHVKALGQKNLTDRNFNPAL